MPNCTSTAEFRSSIGTSISSAPSNKLLHFTSAKIGLRLFIASALLGISTYTLYTLIGKEPDRVASIISTNSFSFYATPNPVRICSKGKSGSTVLRWNVEPGSYQILRGGNAGLVIANVVQSGFLNIADISEDTYFVLQQRKTASVPKRSPVPQHNVQDDSAIKDAPWVTISKLAVTTNSVDCSGKIGTTDISANVRGITFHFLDGWDHDLPWMIENQYTLEIRKKIERVLDTYDKAGINWLRILIAAHHRPYYRYVDSGNPIPSDTQVRQVNDFLALLRSDRFAGKFKIEIVLIPEMNSDLSFRDSAPYNLDKQWLNFWMNNLDFTDIGLVMIGADLMPCAWEGSQIGFRCGNASAVTVTQNHARWIEAVWPWARQNWPNHNMSYEVIAGSSTLAATTMATWISQHTPDVSLASASMYFDLPIGATIEDYKTYWRDVITSFRNSSVKPLWIDEFGKRIGTGYSETDQANFFMGFLEATACGSFPDTIPKLAWVGGDDYTSNRNIWFGLFSGYDSEQNPIVRPAWKALSKAYNAAQCP